MTIEGNTWAALGVLFGSTFIRSAFGFGDAVLAMPLLTMLLGLKTATPLVALVAGSIALGILAKHWRAVALHSAWRLIVSSALGIPVGLYCLTGVSERTMTMILAACIILFAGYRLAQPGGWALRTERTAMGFGFLAGILGGAYNTNGPLVVAYGALRRWPPTAFRATLQGYFLLTGLFILIGHAAAGLWTRPVLRLYLFALPVVALGVGCGELVSQRIRPERFERWVNVLLLGLGLLLLLRTWG